MGGLREENGRNRNRTFLDFCGEKCGFFRARCKFRRIRCTGWCSGRCGRQPHGRRGPARRVASGVPGAADGCPACGPAARGGRAGGNVTRRTPWARRAAPPSPSRADAPAGIVEPGGMGGKRRAPSGQSTPSNLRESFCRGYDKKASEPRKQERRVVDLQRTGKGPCV